MPSTLVHAFLPATCVAFRQQSRKGLTRSQFFLLLVACAFIANLPDLDVVGVILWPEFASYFHRNLGHNALSLVVWVIIGKWILTWISKEFLDLRAYLYSASLVISHIILDAGCLHGPQVPAGVPLLWPFSDWELVTPIPLFVEYHLSLDHDWFLSHLLASDYWTRAVFQEIGVSAVLFACFLATHRLSLKKLRRKHSIDQVPVSPELP